MTFLISGEFLNNRIVYRVFTDDFIIFELIIQHNCYLQEMFPVRLLLDKQRPSFRNSEKFLMQLINEKCNTLPNVYY